MGGFKRIEDRPTPKEVYNWRVYMLAIICGCGALTFGYDGAFIGTTIARPSFKAAMGIDKMTKAQQTSMTTNLTSTFTGSAWFGAVFAWPCMEAFGRKRPMQVSAFLFNLGAILMTVTTHSLSMIYAGRAITGFSVGVLTATIPTFIGEFSPPAIRGQLTGFFEIAYQVGSLVGFWINYGITSHMDVTGNTSWRVAMAVQLIPGGMLAVGSIVLKESPGWLLRKGREGEAMTILSYVRKLPEDHEYLQQEVAMMRVVIDEERKLAGGKRGMAAYISAFIKKLKVPDIRHRMICLFWMFILMNFSGAVVLNCKPLRGGRLTPDYSPTLFTSVGIAKEDVNLYTGFYGLVKAVGAITFCLFIVDRSGRRIPWLLSASGCAITLIYIGAYVIAVDPASKKGMLSAAEQREGTGAVACIMLYSFIWSWGGNSNCWLVSAEMFPISMRSITGAFGAATQWLSSFAATMSAPHMQAAIGGWIFVFYGLCCVATTIFTFVLIPETRGVPVESMGRLFGGPSQYSQWRQKKVWPPIGIPPPVTEDVEAVSSDSEKAVHEHIDKV
ncbi:hypothetical protein CspeluHIS016_0102810 [Cutaneotrichosporon spelunceum]|uniref:Major facilitator superfamily (MFS) profile domain-containing protein n=1 Tax=Cutaneotrichosporon spelunceum TaxID=1672016 RepID=A0AAD3TNT6_9TREE|nr:hypothetical protein CspeluHIS016_0102810 [Cutaneotrichosporon spelunceum]